MLGIIISVIEVFHKNIRVHTVTDILNSVSIDTLRMLADKELIYDISAMPDADRDASEAYRQEVLAQMSRADLIRCILLRPVVRLFPTDNNTGVSAEYIHDPLMNLYFTRDQSITTPCGHIICRMNSPQRAAETDVIELCYRHMGVAPILRIEGEGRLNAKPGEPEFNTCDIYVREPGTKPYSLMLKDVSFVEYMRGRGFEIIPIDYDDEMHYANNYLTITQRHIMAVAGQSEVYQQRLADAGVGALAA